MFKWTLWRLWEKRSVTEALTVIQSITVFFHFWREINSLKRVVLEWFFFPLSCVCTGVVDVEDEATGTMVMYQKKKNHFTVPIFGWEDFNLMTCYCRSCPIGILERCSFAAPCVPDCRGTRFDDPCVTLGSILVILSLENMWKAVKCTDWNYWWKGEEVWTKNKKKTSGTMCIRMCLVIWAGGNRECHRTLCKFCR